MYSVKETARKITCPTESDEMNPKRIVRYLKGAPSAKSLIEITTPSKFVNVCTDSDWAGQATTCRSTRGGLVQWRNSTLTAWSRTQQTVSLSSAEAEFFALTTGVAEGMVTKNLVRESGHEVILMNHVDSQSAKAWASKRGLERMKHVMLKYARRRGEEVDEAEQTRFDDKVSHIRGTHKRLCDERIETRLKQNREVTEQREDETKRGKREKKSICSNEEEMRT